MPINPIPIAYTINVGQVPYLAMNHNNRPPRWPTSLLGHGCIGSHYVGSRPALPVHPLCKPPTLQAAGSHTIVIGQTRELTQKTSLLGERAHLPINPIPIAYTTNMGQVSYLAMDHNMGSLTSPTRLVF